MEKEVSELKSRGVTFEHYDMPPPGMHGDFLEALGAKTAWFKDSEGNILAIVQHV